MGRPSNKQKLADAAKNKQGVEPPKNLFGEIKGEKFGGGANRLQLEVGQSDGPFTHVRVDNIKLTDDADTPVDIFVATKENGEEIRMPAAAIFRNNAIAANLQIGDKYHVGRDADATKKKGKGKGKGMEVYQILVVSRAHA